MKLLKHFLTEDSSKLRTLSKEVKADVETFIKALGLSPILNTEDVLVEIDTDVITVILKPDSVMPLELEDHNLIKIAKLDTFITFSIDFKARKIYATFENE